MKNERITLGITGHPLCGKDTVAEYIAKKYGFTFVSTSDEVREYMKKNNLGEPTRERMRPIAQKMRVELGADILIKMALEHHKDTERIIFGGIRALAEADAIRKAGGKVIVVSAPIEVRFKRSQERGRTGDDRTFEEFATLEKREYVGTHAAESNINGIIAGADYTIENVGTLEELYEKVDEVMTDIINMLK